MRPSLPAILVGVLFWSTVSLAAPTKNPEREARALYRTGVAFHNLADYPAAIADFKRAYELTHAAGLLFNLAQSHRLNKDYGQALHFYQTYLREMPNAPNRRDAEGLIVKVEALLRAAEVKPKPSPPPSLPLPAPEPAVRVVLVPAPILPPPVVVQPKPRRRTLFIAGLATLGVGVVALAAGLGTGLHATDQANAIDRLRMTGGTWDAQAQNTYADGARSSNAAIALYAVGGVLAATGVVMTVVGSRRAPKLMAAAHPLVGGGSLEVSCVF